MDEISTDAPPGGAAERHSRSRVAVGGSVVAIAIAVAVAAAVASNHASGQRSRADGGTPAPASPTASGRYAYTPLGSPQGGDQALATTAPKPSPSGVAPAPPADAYYPCYDKNGATAICSDVTGAAVLELGTQVASDDVSIDQAAGYVYYRVFGLGDGTAEGIGRTPLAGGAPQTLVRTPPTGPMQQISLGSPVASPDGNLLAYGEMTLTSPAPGQLASIAPAPAAGSPASSPRPMPLGHAPSRQVQILVRNLHDLNAAPVVVPAALVGSDVAAGPLLGWSSDSRQLFLMRSDGAVQSLAIDRNGVATGISTVFNTGTVLARCQIARTMMSASGDFYVAGSCASSIRVVRVHNGKAQPFGTLLSTEGWSVSDVQLDTTGRFVTLSYAAPPQSPQCLAIDGGARIIDGVPTGISFDTTPGCRYAGAPPGVGSATGPAGVAVASPPK